MRLILNSSTLAWSVCILKKIDPNYVLQICIESPDPETTLLHYLRDKRIFVELIIIIIIFPELCMDTTMNLISRAYTDCAVAGSWGAMEPPFLSSSLSSRSVCTVRNSSLDGTLYLMNGKIILTVAHE